MASYYRQGHYTNGGTSSLDDIDDVNISTPQEGDILVYKDGMWVNDNSIRQDIDKIAEAIGVEL